MLGDRGGSDPVVDEEDGPGRIDLDRQCDQPEQRREHDQPDHGHADAHDPAEAPIDPRVEESAGEAPGEDETARRQRFDGELAGEVLVRLDGVLDEDAARAAFEELADGQPSAPLPQRHDDPIAKDGTGRNCTDGNRSQTNFYQPYATATDPILNKPFKLGTQGRPP